MAVDENSPEIFVELGTIADLAGGFLAALASRNPALQFEINAAGQVISGMGAMAIAGSEPAGPTIPADLTRAAAAFMGAEVGYLRSVAASQVAIAAISATGITLSPFASALVVGAIVVAGAWAFGNAAQDVFDVFFSFGQLLGHWYRAFSEDEIKAQKRDPLALDLDGDGIELVALNDANGDPLSTTHFDLDGDGFAERTGWVSSDDGILVRDVNQNGIVDNVSELFGSATQDGFMALEALDTNMDGKVDASDAVFGDLRVWRDFNQNGVSESGELFTLAELGIESISVQTQDATGTNAGHSLGVTSLFTNTDGSTGEATSIWFQTDLQDTVPDESGFVPATDVAALPQLPRSGTLHSIAWTASNDADFQNHLTSLVQNAGTMSPGELRASFEALLLEWAGADAVVPGSRGNWVDARHLAFVEAFFGTGFTLVNGSNATIAHSPASAAQGAGIEATFDQIVETLMTLFLAQVPASQIAGGAQFADVVSNPFFFYSMIDFRDPATLTEPSETPGNIGMVVSLIKALAPTNFAESVDYFTKALAPLKGVTSFAFANNASAYEAFVSGQFSDIADTTLRSIAIATAIGNGEFGTASSEALFGSTGNDVFDGGAGNDIILSGAGSDIYIYAKGDADDIIREHTVTANDLDILVLQDILASEVTYQRAGNTLIISITGGGSISVENFFRDWANQTGGLDIIRFSDGTTVDRALIQLQTVSINPASNIVVDSILDDTIRGGQGHDQIQIGAGNDRIVWSTGDGDDIISDSDASGFDSLELADLRASEVVLSQVGNSLLIKVSSTGEIITVVDFFKDYATGANRGIDQIRFSDGIVWNRDAIHEQAWIRGTDSANGIGDTALNDIIVGNGGADSISLTNGGNDTVHWAKGDGDDTILASASTDTGTKTLILDDLNPNEVSFSYQGSTLLITVISTGEVIRVADQFLNAVNLTTSGSPNNYGLDFIQFANGAVLNRDAIDWRTGHDFVGLSFDSTDPNFSPFLLPTTTNGTMISGGSGNSPSGTSVVVHYNYRTQTDEFGNVYVLDVWGLSDAQLYEDEFHNVSQDGSIKAPLLLDGIKDAFSAVASGVQTATGADLAAFALQLNFDSSPATNEDYDFNYLPPLHGDFVGNHGGIIVSLYSNLADVPLSFLGTNARDIFMGCSIYNGGAFLDDVVFTADGDDIIYGKEGDDILSGGSGHDMIDGGDGIDIIAGGEGSDVISAGKGNDAVHGGEGSDYISGDSGNDVIIGGLGDDVLQGGGGSDTYVYHSGDGSDYIGDAELLTSSQFDILKFTDIASTGVEFARVGNDLVITILATGDTITVDAQYNTQYFSIEEIQFSDGVIYDRADIAAQVVTRGTDGRDFIIGTSSSETIIGGTGDDFLVGNTGSDTFAYAQGDGNDEIKELYTTLSSNVDTLRFTDLDMDQIEIYRTGLDMFVRVIATDEVIRVVNQFQTNVTLVLEQMVFADGSILLASDFRDNLILRGTNVSETMVGSASGETIIADSGNDTITGGGGSDIYVYQRGAGSDTIIENSGDQYNGTDRLKFLDINATEIELVKTGTNDILIRIAGTNETILLVAQTYQYNKVIEEIEFADGTIWDSADIKYWRNEGSRYYGGTIGNDTLIGSYLDQTLEGGMGNDTIDGKTGTDYLYGGTGNDTLVISVAETGIYDRLDGGDGTDTLSLATLGYAVDVDLVTNNGEVRTGWTATLPGSGLFLIATIIGLENITGSAFNDAIRADANANTINAGDGDDYIDGRSGNDTLNGGAGIDTIFGNTGNDTIDGGSGSDYLNGGLGTDTITYASSTAAIEVNLSTGAGFGGYAEGDTLIDIENVTGSSFDDVFRGNNLANSFSGGAGNDLFFVSGGVDTFNGGTEIDTASFEGFNFAVKIDLANTAMEVYHRNGTTVTTGTWQSLVNFVDVENAIGTSFADEMYGNAWANSFAGGAGNDKLVGAAGTDILNGGLGNDTLTGGADADTYAYLSGVFGNDVITDFQDGIDRIDLSGSGLTFSSFTIAQSGADTVLSYFDGTNSNTIRFTGITASLIDAADFVV